MPLNNPLAPFIKGDFPSPPGKMGFPQVPLRKGGFRGLSGMLYTNFEIPEHSIATDCAACQIHNQNRTQIKLFIIHENRLFAGSVVLDRTETFGIFHSR